MSQLAYTMCFDKHSGRWRVFSIRSLNLAKRRPHDGDGLVDIKANSLEDAEWKTNRRAYGTF